MVVDQLEFRPSATPERIAGPALAILGLSVWMGLSVWSGIEPDGPGSHFDGAWNTPAYFLVGVPLMAVAVAVAGFHWPHRCWRWAVWLVAGHQCGVIAGGLGMQS